MSRSLAILSGALLLAVAAASPSAATVVDVAETVQVDGAPVAFNIGFLPDGPSNYGVFFQISDPADQIGQAVEGVGIEFSFITGLSEVVDPTFTIESLGLIGVDAMRAFTGEIFAVDTVQTLPSVPPVEFSSLITGALTNYFILQVGFNNPPGDVPDFAGGALSASTTPIASTPIPAAIALLGSGLLVLIGFAGVGRRSSAA